MEVLPAPSAKLFMALATASNCLSGDCARSSATLRPSLRNASPAPFDSSSTPAMALLRRRMAVSTTPASCPPILATWVKRLRLSTLAPVASAMSSSAAAPSMACLAKLATAPADRPMAIPPSAVLTVSAARAMRFA